MIKLATDCGKCTHQKVCSYRANARHDMERLKNMQYGKGPNDDYDWETMMKARHVDITFSCPDFVSGFYEKQLYRKE